jgi:ribosomal protein S18 acetylase RimI-like enzyme
MEVRDLAPTELEAAAGVVARGMRDNPNHVAALGPDEERRVRVTTALFQTMLPGLAERGAVLGAFEGSALVGVCGLAAPGRCRPTTIDRAEMLRALLASGSPAVPMRVGRWAAAWARLDPGEPHWHLGPVAVEPGLQGQGIGSAMLAEFCRRVDAAAQAPLAWLETDRRENLGFYGKHGFTLAAEDVILGVPNWFMERRP